MDDQVLKTLIEGLIFAAGDEGISGKELASLTEKEPFEIERMVHELRVDMKEQKRGIQITRVAQSYMMTTLSEHQKYLEKWASAPQKAQLSRAAIETLAIIAYQQPITRLEIEEIRGVKSDRLVQLLQRKGLIRNVGRAEGVGRPKLYGTTKEFLQYFGLNHINELPAAHTIFNWKEWEEEKEVLFQRLGVETEQEKEQDE